MILCAVFGCKNKQHSLPVAINKINSVWLDSIIKNSDTSYSKPYKRTDFVTTSFYINKEDSSICQLMKDSAFHIRQIIIARKNIRTHFSQYYANGQLLADIPLNKFGQNEGTAAYYYQDGTLKTKGDFKNNLYAGKWENFDEKGKLIKINQYNSNGNLVESMNP